MKSHTFCIWKSSSCRTTISGSPGFVGEVGSGGAVWFCCCSAVIAFSCVVLSTIQKILVQNHNRQQSRRCVSKKKISKQICYINMLHFVGPAPDLFSTCTISFKPRLAPLMISISSELLGSTSSILSKKNYYRF